MATELRTKFPKVDFTELAAAEPEAWVKENFHIATKTAHQNGTLRGTPKGQHKDVVKSSTRRVAAEWLNDNSGANSG